MKKILLAALPCVALWASEQQQVLDCNIIFEQRKGEILQEIEKINEQQQALQALQDATQNILNQKEEELKKREAMVNATKEEIAQKEEAIAKMLKKNQEVLKQIKEAKNSKVGETYAGMKDSKSAAILENLPPQEAAEILLGLDTKIMSKILAKMNPQKAAELTQLITKTEEQKPRSN